VSPAPTIQLDFSGSGDTDSGTYTLVEIPASRGSKRSASAASEEAPTGKRHSANRPVEEKKAPANNRLVVRDGASVALESSSPLLDLANARWFRALPGRQVFQAATETRRTTVISKTWRNTTDCVKLTMIEPVGVGPAVHILTSPGGVCTLEAFINAEGAWHGDASVVYRRDPGTRPACDLTLPGFLEVLEALVPRKNYVCWQGRLDKNVPDGPGFIKTDRCSLEGHWQEGLLLKGECTPLSTYPKMGAWQYDVTSPEFQARVATRLKTPTPGVPQVRLTWAPRLDDSAPKVLKHIEIGLAASRANNYRKLVTISTCAEDGPVRPALDMLRHVRERKPYNTVDAIMSVLPDTMQSKVSNFLTPWHRGYYIIVDVAKMLEDRLQNTEMYPLFKITLFPPLVPKRITVGFDKFPLMDEVVVDQPNEDRQGMYWQDGQIRFIGTWCLKPDPEDPEYKICTPREGVKYQNGKWCFGTFLNGKLARGQVFAGNRVRVGPLVTEGEFKDGYLHGGGKTYDSEGRLAAECESWVEGRKQGYGTVYHPQDSTPLIAEHGTFKDDLLDCARGEKYAKDGHPLATGVFVRGRFVGPGIQWCWDPIEKKYTRMVSTSPQFQDPPTDDPNLASRQPGLAHLRQTTITSIFTAAAQTAASNRATVIYELDGNQEVNDLRAVLTAKPNIRLVTPQEVNEADLPLELLQEATHVWIDDDLSWDDARRLLRVGSTRGLVPRLRLLPSDQRLLTLIQNESCTLSKFATLRAQIQQRPPLIPVIVSNVTRIPQDMRKLLPADTVYYRVACARQVENTVLAE